MNVVETERLTLSQFSLDDAAFIYELLNDPDWLRFIGDRNIHTIDDARAFISERLIVSYEKFGFGFYLVKEKETNASIGMCGLVKRDFLENVDIGYAFLPKARGKGLAFEAGEAVIAYGMKALGLNKIAAITDMENVRSIHLLQKLGLHPQGTVVYPGEDTPVRLFTTI